MRRLFEERSMVAKVGMLVGSLRKGSLTRKVAKALGPLAPGSLDCSVIEIGDLPLYNEDLDDEPPAAWSRFRSQIKNCDAVLFLTPEYNRSFPGCLKNAVDIGSRPEGKNLWDGLPAAVISVTPYKMGAFGANHALRQTFVFLNMPVMQQPEAYIGGAGELFDESGSLQSSETREFLARFMTSFAHWIETNGRSSARHDFSTFMNQRESAAKAYTNGDAAPLDDILLRSGEASFFPPNGGSVRGAPDVATRYDQDARSFAPGGTTELEVLQSGADGDIAFWTGFQKAVVKMNGKDKPIPMKLRITELFRLREGGWKLIHRHADPAAEVKKPNE
jgi:NAD(P)H-dependent FMN reductase/ketosteroid isomerase-like protein